jgi:poly(A) polymerase
MNKTHKTAVVVIPPEDVWAPIQGIRQQHDSKVRRWMPHITLIYPCCDEALFGDMALRIEEACGEFAVGPFEVELQTFCSFRHGKGRFTVWLSPEPEQRLLDLHAAVWTGVAYDVDFEPRTGRFTPHLSVGQVRGREKRHQLVADLQRDWSPVRFLVDRVHCIVRGDPPNDRFEVAQTVVFNDN